MLGNSRFTGIRWKMLLPGLGALAVLFVLMEALWVPWQVATTQTEIQEEQHLRLRYLSLALIEPLLSEDLGQLHSTLDSVLVSDGGWHWLELRDANDQRLFPLGKEPALQDSEVVVSHAIEHDGRHYGVLILRYDASIELAAADAPVVRQKRTPSVHFAARAIET